MNTKKITVYVITYNLQVSSKCVCFRKARDKFGRDKF